MARPFMTHPTLTLAAIGALLLAGCERAEPPIESEPTPKPIPTETEPPISILRESPTPAASETPPPTPFEKTISFAKGGNTLDETAHEAIAEIVASEQFQRGGAITLWGHTDSVGQDQANLRTSARRAEAVAEELKIRGANPENITIIPLGEMRAIAPNAKLDGTPDEEGRAKNRRVEVSVAPPPVKPADADSGQTDKPLAAAQSEAGATASTAKTE